MIQFKWRRYGDEKPQSDVNMTISVVVIRGGKGCKVESGSYYIEEEEYFLNEDFRRATPDDLWVYQHELAPKENQHGNV